MEDTILSVSTLPEPIHRRILSKKVRVHEANGTVVLIPVIDKDEKDDKPHVRFIGSLSAEDYDEISEILADTQRVDADEW